MLAGVRAVLVMLNIASSLEENSKDPKPLTRDTKTQSSICTIHPDFSSKN